MTDEGVFPKSDGDILYASEVSAFTPPGIVVAWLKTFGAADSGTDDAGTPNKLTETGQNFETTVKVDMIVHNTTDNTFANVTAIDSNTVLSLDADIMDNGEEYIIYKTTKLPTGWVECNGQVLDDENSIYDGETIPDLNGDNRFLRGEISSGGTGGTETHNHKFHSQGGGTLGGWASDGASTFDSAGNVSSATGDEYTNKISTLPTYYEIVWIMRVK